MSKPLSPFEKIKLPVIGIILASLSSITYCCQCVMVKLVPDFSRQAILIHRAIYMAVFCAPVILHSGHSFLPKNLGQCLIICITGSIATLSILFLYKSLDFLPLSDCTVLTKTELIFTAILGLLILQEKPHLIDVIVIMLSIVGIILITRPSFVFEGWNSNMDNQSRIYGSFLAVACGFCVSLMNVIVRRINFLHYAVIIFNNSIIQTIILCSYKFIANETIIPECGTIPWMILGIGILSFGTQYFYVNALFVEKASCVALVTSLGIFYSYIFQLMITGEVVTLLSVSGAFFIMVSVTMKACLQWYS
ncbi:solute carrier family 35 member G1-like [Tachypleus tridentatus]|uniref:solute carrier family 35 member G1-like n=1 Tax=Tachypleus tridentatus TaxID=6853 RepID=UPI003FD4A578